MIERAWIRSGPTPRGSAPILADDEVRSALAMLRGMPEHRATALLELTDAARRAGVARVLYKDESTRFGAGSFKAAGAAYAVWRAAAEARAAGDARPTLCCATDGNHGRAVAWAAARHGCDAVVYLPDHAHPERERRIAALGARIVHVAGSYDVAVERARDDAARNGWIVVSDTSDVPGDSGNLRIMAGYALVVEEVLDALGDAPAPTHVCLQAGVGTLAAGVVAQLDRRLGDSAPRTILVEPARADCVLRSLEADREEPVGGSLHTVMDCLAAGRVSATAWPLLRARVDAAIAIDDAACERALASATAGELGPPLDVGPSGVAGLAGLLELAADEALRAVLSLDGAARVLLIGTEQALPRA